MRNETRRSPRLLLLPVIADVLISYMESQICLGWAAAMGHGFDVPAASPDSIDSGSGGAHLLGGVGLRKGMTGPGQSKADGDSTDPHAAYYAALRVPSARLGDRPSDVKDFREVEPFCVSANDLINPLPPSLFYGSGWHAHHPEKGDNDDKHYWYAEQPTSRLRVPVKIGAGEVSLDPSTFFSRSFRFLTLCFRYANRSESTTFSLPRTGRLETRSAGSTTMSREESS